MSTGDHGHAEVPAAGIYPAAWAVWAALTAASFAAIEFAAIRSAPGTGTLSAQLRRRRRVNAALIAGGAAWLVHHIAVEGTYQEETRNG